MRMHALLVGCLLLASLRWFCFFEHPVLYASAMEAFDPAFSLGFLLKCFTSPTIYKPLCFSSVNHLYINLKVSVPADITSVLYPHQDFLKDPFKILLPPEVRENIFPKLTV